MRPVTFSLKAAGAVFLLVALAGAETTVQHPAYLRALSELRDARAHLSVRAAELSTDSDEQMAIGQIDKAMQDVREASEDDGKGVEDHGPLSAGGRQEQLRWAMEKLEQAQEDIELRQQDSFLKGYKANSAQEHIEEAKRAIRRALRQ